MPEDCREIITSEQYLDLIVPPGGIIGMQGVCSQNVGGLYEIQHWLLSEAEKLPTNNIGYYMLPKLYGLLDTSNMEASGIPKVQNQPVLALKGSGVLIGFLDTGERVIIMSS